MNKENTKLNWILKIKEKKIGSRKKGIKSERKGITKKKTDNE